MKNNLTDTDRLDWLEKQANGIGVVHDDNMFWCVSGDGIQPVITGRKPKSFMTGHFVDAKKCRKTIREAIDLAINESGK